MGKKIITILLFVLFIITFLLGLYGFTNRDRLVEETPTPLNSNVIVIPYNNDQININSLDTKIADFDFVKANKGFESNYLKITINGDEVVVDIQKSGITNPQEELSDVITYTIKDVSSVIGVQGHISKSDGNPVKIYMIDKYGRLFLSTFNANPDLNQGITTYNYSVKNIESFASLTIPLLNETTVSENYCIFKTKDGAYYSDYNFNNSEEKVINKIINVNVNQ